MRFSGSSRARKVPARALDQTGLHAIQLTFQRIGKQHPHARNPEDIREHQPLDPNEAARRGMRRASGAGSIQRSRYRRRRLRPRARRPPGANAGAAPLAAPTAALADVLAEEWRAQREFIDPSSMPLTRLANSIIDGVADAAPEWRRRWRSISPPISFSIAPRRHKV
jgi:hypothetical protein